VTTSVVVLFYLMIRGRGTYNRLHVVGDFWIASCFSLV